MIERINSHSWHDFSLEKIDIEYDQACITISMNENYYELLCKGFVGIQYFGQWDENVIYDMKVEREGKLCKDIRSKMLLNDGNVTKVKGSGYRDFYDTWFELKISLIDGVVIFIICSGIEMAKHE